MHAVMHAMMHAMAHAVAHAVTHAVTHAMMHAMTDMIGTANALTVVPFSRLLSIDDFSQPIASRSNTPLVKPEMS